MENNELYHYGRKGMKWYQNIFSKDKSSGSSGKSKKAGDSDDDDGSSGGKQSRSNSDSGSSTSSAKPKPKSVKDMSDEELNAAIKRLESEQRYNKLMKDMNPEKEHKAKEFVMDVVEKSGKNIATQFVTYSMGVAVNKAFEKAFNDDKIVNPKKGQKDK